MRVVKALVAMLLLIGVGVAGAPVAFAHTELKSSNPSAGAVLASAPTEVTLTFEEAVVVPNNAITITGPGGATWTVGTPRVTGAVITAPVQANGPAGAYTLSWKAKGDDGDPLTGTVPFTLSAPAGAAAAPASPSAAAAPAAPAAPATPSVQPVAQQAPAASGGVPSAVWIVGIVLVVAIVAGGVVLARRRGTQRS